MESDILIIKPHERYLLKIMAPVNALECIPVLGSLSI
jgi:hypothetical protein